MDQRASLFSGRVFDVLKPIPRTEPSGLGHSFASVGLLVYQWQLDRSDPPGQGHVRDAPRVSISVNS